MATLMSLEQKTK